MPALIYGALGLTLGAILWWILGALLHRERAGALLERCRRGVRSVLAPISAANGRGYLFGVIGLSLLGLSLACYSQREVLSAVIDLAAESRSADLVALSADRAGQHHAYEFTFTGLILAILLSTGWGLGTFYKQRSPRDLGEVGAFCDRSARSAVGGSVCRALEAALGQQSGDRGLRC